MPGSAGRAQKFPLNWLSGVDGRVRRFAIVAGGITTFVLVASVIEPFKSEAEPAREAAQKQLSAVPSVDPSDVVRALVQMKQPHGWPLLGALVGKNEMVLVHASPQGPRYSVFTHQGQLLEPDLSADDVYRSFPSLDIKSLRLDPASTDRGTEPPIMMVVPEDR